LKGEIGRYVYRYVPGSVSTDCDPDEYTEIKESESKRYSISLDSRDEGKRKQNGEVAYRFCKTLYIRAEEIQALIKGIASG
jgi:hypothetical protein